jgi:hypothetical protein
MGKRRLKLAHRTCCQRRLWYSSKESRARTELPPSHDRSSPAMTRHEHYNRCICNAAKSYFSSACFLCGRAVLKHQHASPWRILRSSSWGLDLIFPDSKSFFVSSLSFSEVPSFLHDDPRNHEPASVCYNSHFRRLSVYVSPGVIAAAE